jgi:2-hydroxy-6-oxonona-2,4-dienedioate hydrolase
MNSEATMRSTRILTITGAIAAGASAFAYAAYRKDLRAAKERLKIDRQVIQSPQGPIEFAESGNGPAVLVVHGAGGGFDQGLDLGRGFLGNDYRLIAPSRFGYLGTPVPADASAEAQADAHARVLDALNIDRVPVIGVSAGGPSAMQFCLRHRDRCTALILVVPLAYAPSESTREAPSPLLAAVLNAIVASDFIFWTMMKVARPTLIKTIAGTPIDVYRNAPAEGRRNVEAVLETILPVSRRAAGIANDTLIATTLTRYPLENIGVPALVISAEDCLYGTCPPSIYTAGQIPGAKLVTFPTGGHLLVGHEDEVRSQITTLLKEVFENRKEPAHAH